jgi:hypothetical protein
MSSAFCSGFELQHVQLWDLGGILQGMERRHILSHWLTGAFASSLFHFFAGVLQLHEQRTKAQK